MLIDLHAHTSGISRCCRAPYNEIIDCALQNGIDGIVLTNHYDRTSVVEDYITEYETAKAYGDTVGCKVFFGIEITMDWDVCTHLLVYGLTPDFLREHPSVYACTQAELYELVKANNGVLVQAHPYRNNRQVLEPRYLDGVEINCHPLYGNSYSERLLAIAKEHDLLVTCGGDYHADVPYRPRCGMILPNTVTDSDTLRDYLLSDTEKTLSVHEPNTAAPHAVFIK